MRSPGSRCRKRIHDPTPPPGHGATPATRHPRDLKVNLARHYFVAQQLGQSPPVIFDDVAGRLPDWPAAELFRVVGARQDVALKAFGGQLVQTTRPY